MLKLYNILQTNNDCNILLYQFNSMSGTQENIECNQSKFQRTLHQLYNFSKDTQKTYNLTPPICFIRGIMKKIKSVHK